MKERSLYSGVGGGLPGTRSLGWRRGGHVEWNDCCQRVLRQRIERNPDAVVRGMERLETIGNGQMASVVELAWRTMT